MTRRMVSLPEFLTPDEITRAGELYHALPSNQFASTVEREIIAPNMARINATLGQENNARYLAYAVEYIFSIALRDK